MIAPMSIAGSPAGRAVAARLLALDGLEQLPHQRGVELVARAVGDDVADEVLAEQGEVADHVEDLVPDALVGIAERVADRPRRGRRSGGRPRSSASRCPPARSASASASSRNVRLGGQLVAEASRARRRRSRLWRADRRLRGRSRGDRRGPGPSPSPGWAVRTACPSRTVTGRSMTRVSRGRSCSTMPAAASASTKAWLEPSQPGVSGASISIGQLSIRRPGERGHDVLDHLDAGRRRAGWSSAAGGGRRCAMWARTAGPLGQVGADEDDARVRGRRAGTAWRRRCRG